MKWDVYIFGENQEWICGLLITMDSFFKEVPSKGIRIWRRFKSLVVFSVPVTLVTSCDVRQPFFLILPWLTKVQQWLPTRWTFNSEIPRRPKPSMAQFHLTEHRWYSPLLSALYVHWTFDILWFASNCLAEIRHILRQNFVKKVKASSAECGDCSHNRSWKW